MIDLDKRKTWLLEGKTPIEKTVNQILLNKESATEGSQEKFKHFNSVLDTFQKNLLQDLNKEVYDLLY